MTPTVKLLKQWARDNAPLASAALAARVYAEAKREEVDAYIKPIFDAYQSFYITRFTPDPRWPDAKLKTYHDLYLAADSPRLAEFYQEVDDAHRAHGFDGPKGHCPALVAENLQMVAERALIEAAGTLFPEFKDGHVYGDLRKRALDLLLGVCVQSGLVTNMFKEARA